MGSELEGHAFSSGYRCDGVPIGLVVTTLTLNVRSQKVSKAFTPRILLFIVPFRYLELVHPVWHRTNFKIKWLYISFGINWVIGIAFNAAYTLPTTKVRSVNVRFCLRDR